MTGRKRNASHSLSRPNSLWFYGNSKCYSHNNFLFILESVEPSAMFRPIWWSHTPKTHDSEFIWWIVSTSLPKRPTNLSECLKNNQHNAFSDQISDRCVKVSFRVGCQRWTSQVLTVTHLVFVTGASLRLCVVGWPLGRDGSWDEFSNLVLPLQPRAPHAIPEKWKRWGETGRAAEIIAECPRSSCLTQTPTRNMLSCVKCALLDFESAATLHTSGSSRSFIARDEAVGRTSNGPRGAERFKPQHSTCPCSTFCQIWR